MCARLVMSKLMGREWLQAEEFEEVARQSCCDSIADVYGQESHELDRYKQTAQDPD